MTDTVIDGAENTCTKKITNDMRYYYLHREEKNRKRMEKYNANPEVIAKRAEREKKKAEKEAAKIAKREENAQRVQELKGESEKTKRMIRKKVESSKDVIE